MRKFIAYLFSLAAALVVLLAMPVSAAADDFLEPEAAFRFSAQMIDSRTAEVAYDIADGYYMYRERFQFRAEGAKLGQPQMPSGQVKFDETFNKNVETYHHRVVIRLPVDAAGTFVLISTGQGCAEKGLCYPPMDSRISLTPPAASPVESSAAPAAAVDTVRQSEADNSEMGVIEASLKGGHLLVIVPSFILLGLGLAFTPCVLPMVPILSSIIVGEGRHVSRKRGLALSATYSLGMALVYTALGVAAGLVGEGLAAGLQKPWVLGAFALLMAVFSLAMFGAYQIQMPAFIQTRLVAMSEKQQAGKLVGVFVMGAISALIVGPCVAAPLAATLVYISQTRDVMVGGSALFSMAAGMSLPLMLVGVSAGTLLPRAGAWMDAVKRFFGVLMLGLAIWMASSLVPAWVEMAAWGLLAAGYGIYLLSGSKSGGLAKTAGVLFVLLGALQVYGLAIGSRDPLKPWSQGNAVTAEFVRVKSTAELDAALADAGGRVAMLDFYADWCKSCIEMERFTFSDPRVQQRFGKMLLLRIDVTGNTEDDKAMLKRFTLFGPPGIIFFDPRGHEIHGARVVGYQKTDRFLESLHAAGT